MTGLIGCHDLDAGTALSALFDQVRQRLINESLKLSSFGLRQITDI